MTKPLHGIIAYPITPFSKETGQPDLPALTKLVDKLISDGAHAVAPLGSTGESAYLNDQEWEAVAEAAVKQAGKRLPVIVGISDLTTRNAVRRARFAETVGADAVMVLPVSYWKLTENEIEQHFRAIAKAISLPIMLYNNPATSGIDMSPELIVRLVRQIDNVTMVKESSGDIQRMHRIQQLSDGQIPFYNGSNPLALEAFAAGARGWCTAAHNLIPKWTLELYNACQSGNLNQARTLFYKQLPLLQFILKGGLPTTVKAGLAIQGIEVGLPRQPLLPMSTDDHAKLKTLLADLSI
jgi:4-hydroxy-tetrahydrodipicolinate synthase